MVDLQSQHAFIQNQLQAAVQQVLQEAKFIQGPQVKLLEQYLAAYVGTKHAISCANGTDALQIALMALELPPKSEVIVPAFGYVAAAEAVKLLGLTPVFAEPHAQAFNIDEQKIESLITENTKAIIPIHLFGQSCNMLPILKLAQKYNLFVIEDNAQSIGAVYKLPDDTHKKTGSIGHISTTSFFPTKNLACMGDGGAIFTNDDALAKKMRQIAQHGQAEKYVHERVGINSRLDTLQAAILNVKLNYLESYNASRCESARLYHQYLAECTNIQLPFNAPYSTHVYHQFVIKVHAGKRNALKNYLAEHGVPTMIYYPVPLHRQPAYYTAIALPIAEELCENVLALPMHTQLTEEQIRFIAHYIIEFFRL